MEQLRMDHLSHEQQFDQLTLRPFESLIIRKFQAYNFIFLFSFSILLYFYLFKN